MIRRARIQGVKDMLGLLDVAERTRQGPKMAETDWNMGLFEKMNELTPKI